VRPRPRPSALCVAVLAGGLLTGCAAERPEDPVVLTGAATPRLVGADPGQVVAFRWLSNAWAQVPVQVDERAQIDLGKVYNQPAKGLTSLTYTDPGTFAGPDPDPKVDADDEIAFMGFDGGAQAPAGAAPPGVVAGSGEEIRIGDSLGNPLPAFIYLFRQTGGLDPGAGRSYVSYSFGLKSGPYKTTYKLAAGPNPEDSTVTTAAYTRHFSDRWVDDGLQLRTQGSSGADILDRHKALFAPGTCGRSEDTFSAGEGAFIVNKSGPVRALRAYIGANSGPYTERLHVFYQRREDITTTLRVHAIPGIMDFFDFSPAASGMTYRNNLNPDGVKVDGLPDSPALGALTWESVDGDQGGLAQVQETTTNVPGFTSSAYYLDQKTPATSAETQCTGDGAAYGASGPRITQAIPNTDPTIGAASSLRTTRHLFFEPPGASDGPRRAQQIQSPLQVAVAPRG
jgi:hypothetical protein